MNCRICSSNDVFLWRQASSHKLYECNNCQTRFVWPMPSSEELFNSYQSNKSPIEYYLKTQVADYRTFRSRQNYFKDCKSILDVGSNIGTFAKAVGPDRVISIDLNKEAISLCRSSGLMAENKSVFEIIGPFDGVHISEVLEHVPDPIQFLKQINSLLRPGGKLILTTPDSGSRLARSKNWHALLPDEHLYYYTRATIRMILRSAGFINIKIRPSWRYRTLYSVLERTPNYFHFKINLPERITTKICFPLYLGDEMLVEATR